MTDTIIDRLTSHLELSPSPENFEVLLLDVKDALDGLNILIGQVKLGDQNLANLEEEKASLQKVIDAKPQSNGWNIPAPSNPVNTNSKQLLDTLQIALERLHSNALSTVEIRLNEAIKLVEGN